MTFSPRAAAAAKKTDASVSLELGNDEGQRRSSRSHRAVLSQPDDDPKHLSDLLCFVRRQIEAFVVSSDEEVRRYRGAVSKSRGRGAVLPSSSEGNFVGRVGIRCVHCADSGGSQPSPPSSRPKQTEPQQNGRRRNQQKRSPGATSYPQSIRLVYQSVRNWQRYHALTCHSMPLEVREKYLALKAAGRGERSGMDSFRYWEESCRRMGMIDDEEGGIRLRDIFFIVDGSSTDEESECGIDSGGHTGNADEEGGLKRSRFDSDAEFGRAEVQLIGAVSSESENNRRHSPAQNTVVSVPSSNGAEGEQPKGAAGFVQCSVDKVNLDLTDVDAVSDHLRNENEPDRVCVSPLPSTDLQVNDSPAAESACHYAESRFSSPPSCVALGQDPSRRCDALNSAGKLSGTVRNYLQSEGKMEEFCASLSPSTNVQGDASLAAALKSCLLSTEAHESESSLAEPVRSPIIDPEERGDVTARNEAVLERIRLASMMVQAMGQVSPLEGEAKKREDMEVENLRYIGKELYELFSGRSLHGCDDLDQATVREAEESTPQLESKKGKRHRFSADAAEDGTYVPLVDLGFPPALCRLVSSLLYHHVGIGSVEYRSIAEVEEDLRLMAGEPERYLFRAATGDLRMNAIYGREGEMSALLGAYDRAASAGAGVSNDLVLVPGYTGTGKSSLVHSARKHLIQKGACFVSGKFDAMRQIRPLSAIVSALDDFFGMLARDEARINIVQRAFSAAIGGNGTSVLVNLMPNLRCIIPSSGSAWCESPPQIQVGGREALQRLKFLFRMLLRATCSHTHPLVLFLDDLQWADEMSLELMQVLVTDADIQGMLFIGAYRDNEIGEDHPLAKRLGNIRREGSANITSIQVSNLRFDSVSSLVSDALCATPRATWSLSEAVMHKTGGNALFVVEFLASLCDDTLLRFSLSSRRWEWDMDGIKEKDIADNVAELMTAKVLKLAPEVQQALSIAAAFGAQCHNDIIEILDRAQDSVVKVDNALNVAASEGLVVTTESACRFAHDQIQHAAYLLIPESERESFHLKVGRLLWKWSSTEEIEAYLFVLVDQLHRGSRLITDPNEKMKLAQLSLMAGKRASELSAFVPALAYLEAGIGLVTESDWDCDRELCLDLYNSSAEIGYILGDFDRLKRNLEHVFSRAMTLQEKLRAYYTLAQSLFAQNHANDAINTILTVLGHLGESFPDSVSDLLVRQEFVMTQTLLSAQTEDMLFRLERMRNTEKQEAMKFLCKMILCVYLEKKEYFPLVVCRMVRLSLLHGVCKESAFGFACYGVLLIGHLSDFSGGYRYGKVALSILEKFNAKEHFAKVYLIVHGVINNWIEPIQSSLPLLKEAIDVGLATGDTHYAMVSAHAYSVTAMCSGQPLGPLMEEMKLRSKQMIEYKQHHKITAGKPLRQATIQTKLKPLRQAILNLLGECANPIKLIGDEMNEENMLSNAEDGSVDALDTVFLRQTYFYRMYLEYLFGEYELAWETAQNNRNVEKYFVARFPVVCGYCFYHGLISLALARKHGKTNYADTIGKNMKQMEKWASSTQWNCQHKFELMTAEYLFLEGNVIDAAKAYDSAVANAANHSFVNEEALAAERAGLFYLENGMQSSASVFFKRAHDCYTKWGAQSKAAHVQERYKQCESFVCSRTKN